MMGEKFLSSAELFDMITQKWSDLPDINYTHFFGATAMIGTKVCIFGGFKDLKSVEVFDFDTRQWTESPHMSISRWGCAAVAVQSFVVVVGGGSALVEIFDVESQSWSKLQKTAHRTAILCSWVCWKSSFGGWRE